jgi:hypothetical protein
VTGALDFQEYERSISMKFLELLVSFTIDNPLAVLGLIVIGFVLLGYELHCRFTGGYDDTSWRE